MISNNCTWHDLELNTINIHSAKNWFRGDGRGDGSIEWKILFMHGVWVSNSNRIVLYGGWVCDALLGRLAEKRMSFGNNKNVNFIWKLQFNGKYDFPFFSENRGKINWTLEDTPFDCNEFKCHWIACGRRENVGKIQKFISMLFISSKVQLHFYSFFSIFFSIRFMFRVLCLAGFRVQCALCAAWKMIYCVLGKCIVGWLAGFGWLFVGFKAMENEKTENSILFRLENYLHNSFNFCFSLF